MSAFEVEGRLVVFLLGHLHVVHICDEFLDPVFEFVYLVFPLVAVFNIFFVELKQRLTGFMEVLIRHFREAYGFFTGLTESDNRVVQKTGVKLEPLLFLARREPFLYQSDKFPEPRIQDYRIRHVEYRMGHRDLPGVIRYDGAVGCRCGSGNIDDPLVDRVCRHHRINDVEQGHNPDCAEDIDEQMDHRGVLGCGGCADRGQQRCDAGPDIGADDNRDADLNRFGSAGSGEYAGESEGLDKPDDRA